MTIFLLELSVKKETNFCTAELGWWLICISWKVYLIWSSPVICPREPSTLHNMNSHNSYHMFALLFQQPGSSGSGNLTDQIPAPWDLHIPWHRLLWQEGVSNTPVLLPACASGGQGKAVIPGRMNFCRPGALWGTNTGGNQQCSLILLHGAQGKQGQPAQCLLRFQHSPRVKWGYDRSVKGKGFLLWDCIFEVVTWQIWVGCWFSEDCQKATEWIAVSLKQQEEC